MLKRNLTAIVLVSIALVFLLYLRTFYVEIADILFMFFAIMGGFEMRFTGKKAGYNPMLIPIVVYSIISYPLYFILYWFANETILGLCLAFSISVLIALMIFVINRKQYSLNDLIYTCFVLVYPMLICSFFVVINNTYGNLLGVLYVLFVTLLSDAFALFAGVLFGNKKFCEEVSPKKTIAGVYGAYFGGLLGATIVALLFDIYNVFGSLNNVGQTFLFCDLKWSMLAYYLLAILCTTAAIIGDLVASWIKRQIGIKDFGRIFPGHGGIMDRLDSILFVVPIVLTFFAIKGAF